MVRPLLPHPTLANILPSTAGDIDSCEKRSDVVPEEDMFGTLLDWQSPSEVPKRKWRQLSACTKAFASIHYIRHMIRCGWATCGMKHKRELVTCPPLLFINNSIPCNQFPFKLYWTLSFSIQLTQLLPTGPGFASSAANCVNAGPHASCWNLDSCYLWWWRGIQCTRCS